MIIVKYKSIYTSATRKHQLTATKQPPAIQKMPQFELGLYNTIYFSFGNAPKIRFLGNFNDPCRSSVFKPSCINWIHIPPGNASGFHDGIIARISCVPRCPIVHVVHVLSIFAKEPPLSICDGLGIPSSWIQDPLHIYVYIYI